MGLLDSITGAFGLSGEEGSSSTTNIPWKPQRDQLKYGFNEARDLYDRGVYEGEYAAPIDPAQEQGYGWGTGAATDAYNYLPGMYGSWGQQFTPLLNDASQYYQNALQPGANENPYGSQGYMDVMQKTAEYNPAMQGQIDAYGQQVYQNLNENTLPALRYGAAGTGNTASTRRGISEGIAARGAGQDFSNNAAQLYGQNMGRAYNTANNWGNWQTGEQANQMQAADQLYGMGRFGLGLQQQGFDAQREASGNMAEWGDYNQGLQQQQIDAERAQYNAPWENLQRFMQTVGGQQWGGEEDQDTSKFSWDVSMGF